MSSREPANVTFSMEIFAQRGGAVGPHHDGWGVAFYEGTDVRIVREPERAADSAWVRFIADHDISSTIVIAHIRKATQGPAVLRNTQPFVRELGGRMHVFAHNGDLVGIKADPRLRLGAANPVGETDSEYAFCCLLEDLRGLWLGGAVPSLEDRFARVSEFAAQIGELGPANFIYSDGEVTFAHGHRRTQADGQKRPPGLHLLRRSCPIVAKPIGSDAFKLESGGAPQEVALVASVPLTDESWAPFRPGEVIALQGGLDVTPASHTRAALEASART